MSVLQDNKYWIAKFGENDFRVSDTDPDSREDFDDSPIFLSLDAAQDWVNENDGGNPETIWCGKIESYLPQA